MGQLEEDVFESGALGAQVSQLATARSNPVEQRVGQLHALSPGDDGEAITLTLDTAHTPHLGQGPPKDFAVFVAGNRERQPLAATE